jgi:hypothetical protein
VAQSLPVKNPVTVSAILEKNFPTPETNFPIAV